MFDRVLNTPLTKSDNVQTANIEHILALANSETVYKLLNYVLDMSNISNQLIVPSC